MTTLKAFIYFLGFSVANGVAFFALVRIVVLLLIKSLPGSHRLQPKLRDLAIGWKSQVRWIGQHFELFNAWCLAMAIFLWLVLP